MVIPGDGNEEDYEGLDVNGKIALVQRGGIYYEKKMENAARAGAIGMLCYNNTEGMFYMSIAKWSIPAVFISQATGEALKKLENKTITVAKADGAVASPIYGMSDFSSWGTTGELTIKPEITAPGGGIYAAVPGGSYESMDGTSMASPHAAGAMAIVQQALKKSNPGHERRRPEAHDRYPADEHRSYHLWRGRRARLSPEAGRRSYQHS